MKNMKTIKMSVLFCCLVHISSCWLISGGDAVLPVDGKGVTDMPYVLLSRPDWTSINPNNIEGSMESAIFTNNSVKKFPEYRVQAANDFFQAGSNPEETGITAKTPRFYVLPPASEIIPVKSLAIKAEENAKVLGKVLLDASASSGIAAGPIFSAEGAASKYYLVDANMVYYKAKYTLSISDLINQMDSYDLRNLSLAGLPKYYYVLSDFSSNTAVSLNSSGSIAGGTGIIGGMLGGKVKIESENLNSFRNKIFAVGFLEDPRANETGNRFKTSMQDPLAPPLDVERFNLSADNEQPGFKLLEENDPEFKSWLAEKEKYLNEGRAKKSTLLTLKDSAARSAYLIEQYEKIRDIPAYQQMTPQDFRYVLTQAEYEGSRSFLSLNDYKEHDLVTNMPFIISKLATDNPTVYDGAWVLYIPGRSLTVARVNARWKDRRDWVYFEE